MISEKLKRRLEERREAIVEIYGQEIFKKALAGKLSQIETGILAAVRHPREIELSKKFKN